jgi:DNA-binding MarR family transcriptional regulator
MTEGSRAAPEGPAPSVPISPAFLVIGLGALVRAEVEEGLRAHGLTLRHLSALGHLSREPGLSYSELARRAGVTAQSMQATLQQLERDGAVVRRTPPGRGRTARLEVTVTGTGLIARGHEVMTAADRRILDDVSPEQRTPMSQGLFAAFVGARKRSSRSDQA